MRSISEIDSMAVNYRRELGEDSSSPIDIFAVARTMPDLTVVMYPLGENISGMCVKNKHANLIAINSDMTYGRQRFSMAHEFYHLRYDDVSKAVCSFAIDEGDDKEKEADKFASHFLMPSSALFQFLGTKEKANFEKVIWLEQHFGLSRKAMLYRLNEEKKIDKKLFEAMQSDVRISAARLGYDTSLYRATRVGEKMKTTGQYIRLAEKLYKESKISSGKYEEILLDAFREDLVFGEDEVEVEIFD